MPLKKFDDYILGKSKDSEVFEKRVIFASQNMQCELFKTISEESEIFSESAAMPVVVWGDFKFTPKIINENRFSLYNINEVPSISELYENFTSSSFVPKWTRDRHHVASLKFPITASDGREEKIFKTYNAFKKSEGDFNLFTESPKVNTSFDVTIFKKKPIHVQENIRDIGFDVNLSGFKYLDKIQETVNQISNNYVLDLYQLSFGEANGELYLTGINRSKPLNPAQKVKVYEAVYEHHYERKLPVWFKNRLFENNVKDYYRQSHYNSLLLKPKYSISFEKFVK